MMFELHLEGQRGIKQKKTGSEISDSRRPLQKQEYCVQRHR